MNRIFKFKNPENQIEDVEEEAFKWRVFYADNTSLEQFQEEGLIFHQFREIDKSKLVRSFQMIARDMDIIYTILPPVGSKLIHFYKNFIYNAGTQFEKRNRAYIFGYEQNIAGKIHKTLWVISPTGELILCDDLSRLSFE